MLDDLEFILKILFFILSIVWVGKIMILRTDKQIVINPLLITIASLLVVMPQSYANVELMGINIQNIRITLYCVYIVIAMLGIYSTNQKNGIF
ncbi:hypothetical protein [Romboutsia sp.]|uniref:hypothetical protein n=1 Tax=Romboutsia sp. TaxID=1965302 RepID=UPI003F3DDA0C